MLRRRRIVRQLVLTAGLLTAALPALSQPADFRFGNPTRFTPLTGEQLYADLCQGCHMPGGVGAAGAGIYLALAHNPKLASADYLLAIVIGGHKGMPAFGELLNDEQVATIAAFVRTHFGNGFAEEVTPADAHAARH